MNRHMRCVVIVEMPTEDPATWKMCEGHVDRQVDQNNFSYCRRHYFKVQAGWNPYRSVSIPYKETEC